MCIRHAGAVPCVGQDGALILSYFIPLLLPEETNTEGGFLLYKSVSSMLASLDHRPETGPPVQHPRSDKVGCVQGGGVFIKLPAFS